jgi:hypothetical protein
MSEGFVEVAGLLLVNSGDNVDASSAEFFDATAADERVGVGGGYDDARDSCGDESVSAGPGASVVAAGLEGDVGGGALRGETARGDLLESDDLGVVESFVKMSAFAEDFVIANENAANLGVGAGEAGCRSSEAKGALHEEFVLCVRRHIFTG